MVYLKAVVIEKNSLKVEDFLDFPKMARLGHRGFEGQRMLAAWVLQRVFSSNRIKEEVVFDRISKDIVVFKLWPSQGGPFFGGPNFEGP